MESRKMVLFFAGLYWRRRHRFMDKGRGWVGEDEMNGESSMETYILPYVK